jgi:hypothetical protein
MERHLVVAANDWVHEEPFVLRHRIIVDRARFETVTGFTSPDATELAYFNTLDFRFVRSVQRYRRWGWRTTATSRRCRHVSGLTLNTWAQRRRGIEQASADSHTRSAG